MRWVGQKNNNNNKSFSCFSSFVFFLRLFPRFFFSRFCCVCLVFCRVLVLPGNVCFSYILTPWLVLGGVAGFGVGLVGSLCGTLMSFLFCAV